MTLFLDIAVLRKLASKGHPFQAVDGHGPSPFPLCDHMEVMLTMEFLNLVGGEHPSW